MSGNDARFGRRGVLGLGTAAAIAPLLPASTANTATAADRDRDIEHLVELGVAELQRRMSAGRLDARTLTRFYLRRIERMNRRGPRLHAVIETNPDALADAAKLDAERRDQGARGPLHGIPILVKDLFDTADPTPTTAGSLALVGARPRGDSTVVARLRRAGAVILGKANMSEWAGGMAMTYSGGYSACGGQTRSPYRLDRSAGDSSSGTGSEMGGPMDDPAYRKALRIMRRRSRQEGIDAALNRHRLDALLLPTEPPPGKIDLINGDHYLGGSSTPAALAGYPAINVPAGFVQGMPIGITLIGTAWSEPTLIKLAYAYEQATRARTPPRYRPGDVEG